MPRAYAECLVCGANCRPTADLNETNAPQYCYRHSPAALERQRARRLAAGLPPDPRPRPATEEERAERRRAALLRAQHKLRAARPPAERPRGRPRKEEGEPKKRGRPVGQRNPPTEEGRRGPGRPRKAEAAQTVG